jgi:hypothetical protein
MEQVKAICTQIHYAVFAYYTGLPDLFSWWHRPYVPKARVQYVDSKSTKYALSTRARFNSLMDLTRFIKPGYW